MDDYLWKAVAAGGIWASWGAGFWRASKVGELLGRLIGRHRSDARISGILLDSLGLMLGLERKRRTRRAWWALWLGWRDESDEEFRTRLTRSLHVGGTGD